MNKIDFTQPGGFPLTQNELAFIQDAYSNPLLALAGLGDAANPYIISGCVVTGDEPNIGCTEGWIYANGNIWRCEEVADIGADFEDAGFQLRTSTGSRRYNDGALRDVVSTRLAVFCNISAADPSDGPFLPWDIRKAPKALYDIPEPYVAPVIDVYSNENSVSIGSCDVLTSVRAMRNRSNGLVTGAVWIVVNNAHLLSPTPPNRAIVNTGLDLPWSVNLMCTYNPVTYHIPIGETAYFLGSTLVGFSDSAGGALEFAKMQIQDTRIYLALQKTANTSTSPSNCSYLGAFSALESFGW